MTRLFRKLKHGSFPNFQQVFLGKANIVGMSRRIAADLYQKIIALRPKWQDADFYKGVLKVVLTSSSFDKIAFDAEDPWTLSHPMNMRNSKSE